VTAAALVDQTLRRHGDRAAIITESGDQMSFTQLQQRVWRLANALTAGLGLKKGDRVSVLSSNRPEYIELDYACALAGLVKVPLYERNAPAEHVYMLEDAGSTALFSEGRFLGPLYEELGQDWQALDGRVVLLPGEGAEVPGVQDYEPLLAGGAAVSPDVGAVLPGDPYHIRYTSGTTGRPKGAVTDHVGMLTATTVNLFIHGMEAPVGPTDVFGHTMAFSHASAFNIAGHSWAGAAHLPIAKFDPERYLDYVQRYGVSVSMMVPSMIAMLLDEDIPSFDISALRTISYAGAPISESVLERALAQIGPVFCQGYGSTEVPSLLTILSKADHVPGSELLRSCGYVWPTAQIEILDDEGNHCEPGEIGEVCIKSASVFTEYVNRPEDTAKAQAGGWYHSGDLGMKDEQGYVYLKDRKNDMIISGGFNIYPAEVENAIMSMPDVLECAVVGSAHDKWGEAVSALIRVRDGASLSIDAIGDHCRKQIGSYKRPRRVLLTSDELPKSAVGKVLRREVRGLFVEGADYQESQ
jgi:acyl-CoA synthetase (AMP-forming)/AMP-acid ligase II